MYTTLNFVRVLRLHTQWLDLARGRPTFAISSQTFDLRRSEIKNFPGGGCPQKAHFACFIIMLSDQVHVAKSVFKILDPLLLCNKIVCIQEFERVQPVCIRLSWNERLIKMLLYISLVQWCCLGNSWYNTWGVVLHIGVGLCPAHGPGTLSQSVSSI